jgi:protein-L-isoaspartate O-methyltransferase
MDHLADARAHGGCPESGARIREQRVLATMRAVPRHEFVPAARASFAYDDRPLPFVQ